MGKPVDLLGNEWVQFEMFGTPVEYSNGNGGAGIWKSRGFLIKM